MSMNLKFQGGRICAYVRNFVMNLRNWRRTENSTDEHYRTKRNTGTKAVLVILLLLLYTLCSQVNLNLLKGYHIAQYSGDTYSGPCILPKLNPFDPAMMRDRSVMAPIKCEGYPPIVYIDSDNILQFNKTALKLSNLIQSDVKCECSRIDRWKEDNEIKISDPVKCDPSFDFKYDFLKVECNRQDETVFSNFLTKIHRVEKSSMGEKNEHMVKEGINVLMFGLDTVSRSNSIREIPKTVDFLKTKMKAFDFQGYMKVADNTFPNLMALLTGRKAFSKELPPINYNEDYFDDFSFIWKNYSDKDYVTFFAEDMPHMNTFNLEKMGFVHKPTDHYMRPYWLAWHSIYGLRKYKAGLALGMLNNKFMKSKIEQYTMCAGDIPNYMAHLKYLKQFINTYKDKKKFAFSFLVELAHNNNNFLHLSDSDLKQFFEDLYNSDQFSNTFIIVFADHGPKTGHNFLTARLEKSLPMLYIVVPKALQEQHPDIVRKLRENEKRLTTHYDMYTTLLDIVSDNYGSPSKHYIDGAVRGYSLFGTVPKDRSCKDAAIPEHFCVCYKAKPLPTENNEFVNKMAASVVDKINHFLSGKSDCSILTFSKLIEVNQISEGSLRELSPHVIRPKLQMDTRDKYTITIETKPGGGHFYATIVRKGPNIEVLSDIDRVNRYKNQSYCVKEHHLRPLCYCKIQ